jgi:predicted RecA/RadA family phage recombinase
MTQTPAERHTSQGEMIDYTPTSNVAAGDVVEIGSIPLVAVQAIVANVQGCLACEGVFDIPKNSDVFNVGDAVYWNSSGTDVGSNTGAADNATGNLMGLCVENAVNTDTHVRTKLTAAKRTTTIGGAVTATDITGEDSSLAITGYTNAGAIAIAGAAGNANVAGGAVTVTGGAAGTGNAAGGAVTITGGAGDGTGDGGAAGLVGGESGDGASANGGAIAITGGAATNATSGDGGAVAITGGAGPTAGNAGGAVTILSGAGDGTNGTAGAVLIDSSGTGATKGAIVIGTNAASLTFGKMPRIPFSTVAANGGNQATAGALAEGPNLVTGSDNSKGVVLPSCVDGARCYVINLNTDKTLKIYPPTGKQVNLAGANNAITVAANTVGLFFSEGANAWYGLVAATDVA